MTIAAPTTAGLADGQDPARDPTASLPTEKLLTMDQSQVPQKHLHPSHETQIQALQHTEG